MGNKLGKEDDEFQKMIKKMKQKQNQSAGTQTKITINPEQKYLSVMIEKLSNSSLPEELKNKVSLALHQKLSKEELIKTVSIANVLKNNEFDIEASKNTIISSGRKDFLSKNVKFNFDFTRINPYIKKNLLLKYGTPSKQPQQISQKDLEEYERQLGEEERKKMQEEKEIRDSAIKSNFELAMKILKQEIKKMYHPFWKLNKAFGDWVLYEFSAWLKGSEAKCKKGDDRYEILVRKLIYAWCAYLQEGCLYPYKKWLITFLELPQNKLTKALHQLLLQEIFTINNSYLYHSVSLIISENFTPPKINFALINEQQDLITPQLFSIAEQLQIQGNFFNSIYQTSELQSIIQQPEKLLKQLELIKNSICKDIDEYHKLAEKKQCYEIDSDNILGIVNFILTRIPYKIEGIYKQLVMLRIVYGDTVYYSHGIASYMLSTLSGSMEFLESEEFMKLIKENPLVNKKPISPPTKPKDQDATNSESAALKESTTTKPSSPRQKIIEYLEQKQHQPNPMHSKSEQIIVLFKNQPLGHSVQ